MCIRDRYHLSKRGMKDVVLLERKQLTCGTTWHAAGLVSMLWPTPTLTNLAKYCHELYASLESETGQATGYKRIGSVSLARNEERLEELQRNSSMAKVFGVESRMIHNDELESMYPGIESDGVIGSLYIEKDGQTNPIDTTMALAKGARNYGAKIIENIEVEEILTKENKVVGVRCGDTSIKGKNKIIKLSSNENSHGPSPSVLKNLNIHKITNRIHRYPEIDGSTLRNKIAKLNNIDQDRIVLGCGSDEILLFAALSFCKDGDEIIQAEHGFEMYPIIAKI